MSFRGYVIYHEPFLSMLIEDLAGVAALRPQLFPCCRDIPEALRGARTGRERL